MFLVRTVVLRRLGPVGVALTAYDVWRRIPVRQRKRLLAAARRRGSRIAAQLGR